MGNVDSDTLEVRNMYVPNQEDGAIHSADTYPLKTYTV